MPEFVTVRTYDAPTPAKLAATALEDADIEVRVVDDEIVAADPLLSQAYGGVKLEVPEPQVERAREILADERDGALEEDVADIEDEDYEPLSDEEKEEWEEVTEGLRCPECASESVGLDPVWMWGWLFGSIGLLFSGPLWPKSVPLGGCVAGSVLGFIGMWALILRKFPLACKDCNHSDSREAFDPTSELDDGE